MGPITHDVGQNFFESNEVSPAFIWLSVALNATSFPGPNEAKSLCQAQIGLLLVLSL